LAQKKEPEVVLFLSSTCFCSVAPALAAVLKTGITADCTDLSWSPAGEFLQRRLTFGGRKSAVIKTAVRPVIATVRSGVFPPCALTAPLEIPCETVPVAAGADFCQQVGFSDTMSPSELHSADILFAGGAGLGSRENFALLYTLAEKYGGDVVASRGAVAASYAPYSRQVGQTGITVQPKLYVAFGISGAVQHLSGMIGSGKIVSVNPDEKAPIHQVSDYSVLADAVEVIRQLLAADA